MLEIPDSVVHSAAIAIDEGNFFGRIDLRNRPDASAHKEAQIFVRRTAHIRVEKGRMFRIVNGGEHVGVDVVDRFAFQESLGQAFGYFMAMTDTIFPTLE